MYLSTPSIHGLPSILNIRKCPLFSSPYPPTVKQQQDLYDFSHQITTAGTVHLLQTSKCVNVNDKTFKGEKFWIHS